MNKRETVKAVLLEIVNEVTKPAEEIEDLDEQQLLVDQLGLTSLDLARLVAVLEMELDTDPFSDEVPITGVRTVGDLLNAYDPASRALLWAGEPA
jgi:acyl carrier protein